MPVDLPLFQRVFLAFLSEPADAIWGGGNGRLGGGGRADGAQRPQAGQARQAVFKMEALGPGRWRGAAIFFFFVFLKDAGLKQLLRRPSPDLCDAVWRRIHSALDGALRRHYRPTQSHGHGR